MFFLGLVYLIVLVVFAICYPPAERWRSGLVTFILFVIIGIVLFWKVLNQ